MPDKLKEEKVVCQNIPLVRLDLMRYLTHKLEDNRAVLQMPRAELYY